MAVKHGITSISHERIVMGPGAVYINDTLLGATKGGNTLEINRTFRDIRPDGAKGMVKGYRRLESVEAILTVKLLELTPQNIYYALAGSAKTSTVISGGEIDNTSYFTEVELVAEYTGATVGEALSVEIALANCLVEGPFTMNLPETGETVVEMKFHAHYSPAAMTTEPWTITFTHVT